MITTAHGPQVGLKRAPPLRGHSVTCSHLQMEAALTLRAAAAFRKLLGCSLFIHSQCHLPEPHSIHSGMSTMVPGDIPEPGTMAVAQSPARTIIRRRNHNKYCFPSAPQVWQAPYSPAPTTAPTCPAHHASANSSGVDYSYTLSATCLNPTAYIVACRPWYQEIYQNRVPWL